MTAPLAPTAKFNALPEDEKKKLLAGGLGASLLHSGLEHVIPLWWLYEDSEGIWNLRNGSAFLVNLGKGVFVVTAEHVFTEYREAKKSARQIGCQLGSLLFDPEQRLTASRADLDVATFRIDDAEVEQIGKRVVTAGPPHWEPLTPRVGEFAFFGGFPAQTRGVSPTGSFATAPYYAMPVITSVTDHQIACRFDRAKSIDFSGSGLPPFGYQIGGVSGGPMLMPTLVSENGVNGVVWRFAGVIVEAALGKMFEQVVAVRSHYIHADGRLG